MVREGAEQRMANIRLSWLASAGAQSAEHKSEEDRAEKSSSYPNLRPSILHVIRVAVACDPKGTLKLDQVLRRIHSDQRPYPPERDQTGICAGAVSDVVSYLTEKPVWHDEAWVSVMAGEKS